MKNILLIRRDNIGDMVCTTPLIEGIKRTWPDVKLTVLVNKVAQDVALNNPYIDELYVYKKSKHREKGESALKVYLQRLKIFFALRKTTFDMTILANPVPCKYSLRLATMAGAKKIIGAGTNPAELTIPLAKEDFNGAHQVEHTFTYLTKLAPSAVAIPEVNVYLSPQEKGEAEKRLADKIPQDARVYGIHISSRSVKRRWPVESYAQIIEKILQDPKAHVLLFWSPQGALDPNDVGDSARMQSLLQQVNSPRAIAYPTSSIRELIAGLDRCEQVLCSDGGQMHITAALHKKQVVFFGDTNAAAWHPWSGQYAILQSASGDCADISVDEAWAAWQKLQAAS